MKYILPPLLISAFGAIFIYDFLPEKDYLFNAMDKQLYVNNSPRKRGSSFSAKRKVHLPLLVLMFLLSSGNLAAQSPTNDIRFSLRMNVVGIRSVFEPTRSEDDSDFFSGYGFIVGEQNDYLYVVTADHVVRKNIPENPTAKVSIKFFSDQGQWYQASVLNTHYSEDTYDLAVLRVAKPQGFVWRRNNLATERENLRDKDVWFIGRSDMRNKWYIPSQAGKINEGPDRDSAITVDISNVHTGTSGAPLITETGIVGMIIRDKEAGVAIALSIDFIKRALVEWNYPWNSENSIRIVSRWRSVAPSLKNVLAFASSGVNIFAGTYDKGIFRSTDNGLTWTAINKDLPAAQINTPLSSIISNAPALTATNKDLSYPQVKTLEIDGTNLYAGLSLSVFQRLRIIWFNAYVLGNNINNVGVGNKVNNVVSGVYRSVNNGRAWNPHGLGDLSITSLLVKGSSLYVGTNKGVFFSSDGGSMWVPINEGFAKNSRSINTLAADGKYIYAGLGDSVYRRELGGNIWVPINAGLPSEDIRRLVVIGGAIFAGTNGGGVARSVNNGQTWVSVNNGLPLNVTVETLAVSSGNIYVGTSGAGVFVSDNNGESWVSMNEGLSDLKVKSLTISNNILIAGTSLGGVFSCNLQN